MSKWTIKSEQSGRLRVAHPFIRTFPAVGPRLEATLMKLGGVTSYSVNLPTSNVLVRYDPRVLTREDVLDTLASALSRLIDEAESGGLVAGAVPIDVTSLRLTLSTLTLGLASSAAVVPALTGLALIGAALAAVPILFSAVKSLAVERRLRVDVLDSTVVALAVVYRRAFPAAFMVWVVDVSYVLLNASAQASHRRLAEIFGRPVHKTRLLVDGTEVERRVADVQVGDLVVVRSGEQVPVDGTIVSGDAALDQSALTGESTPAERESGEGVFAMSIVVSGRVTVRATRTGEDTNAARMVGLIEQTFGQKLQLQTRTERFADVMVAPTIGLGALGYAVAGPNAMMAVINADFGTGIRVAGPLAMLASLQAATQNSILVKSAHAFETLRELDAVVFDKTGTLTAEVPTVRQVITVDPQFDEDSLLRCVAGVEQRFTHPVARAILREAATRGLQLPPPPEADYRIGFGVRVSLDGGNLRVGSRRFLEHEGVALNGDTGRQLDAIDGRGGSAVLAALGERVVGVIELAAGPRPEAADVVQVLRRRGIEEIHLVSGDHEAPTRALAEQLGIERWFAEVAPADKAAHVRALQARGLRVAMVGDGINDTVGLSQADCSISLRGAADAAVDIANVVFLDGDLAHFETLFEIADNLHVNVQRSLALAVVPNSVCIAGAVVGYFGLGASLIFNNFFNLLAVANGLQAQRGQHSRRPST